MCVCFAMQNAQTVIIPVQNMLSCDWFSIVGVVLISPMPGFLPERWKGGWGTLLHCSRGIIIVFQILIL